MGLFEGLSYRQPMYETNVGAARNILYVDILSAGEVINVLACGNNNANNIQVLMYDPLGSNVYDTTSAANVDCDDDFDTTFDPVLTNAHQHVTTSSGTYEVHLINVDSNQFYRYDVTVTNNVTDMIDPRENGGRLWSDYWYFWAGSFAESRSTDADLFVVADGGFSDTYFIWKLDLTNFAGYGYGIKANDLGVVSPNSAGDIVAGLSVPSSGNSIIQKYKIYLSYPTKNYPAPSQSFTVSSLEFTDSSSTDNAITPSDSGEFSFETDITTTAVFEIIIDVSSSTGGGPDGVFGQGDIYLRGEAVPGTNSIGWDGKDNNGVTVPYGAYDAQLSLRTGEFHFVADDVETSGGPGNVGLKISRANSNGSSTPTAVYWDDFTVLGSTEPNAFNQNGIYDGDHNWGQFDSGGIGNATLIDTYAFAVSVVPNPTPVAVVEDDTPLASIVKSFTPETIVNGQTSTMQFEISNPGTDPLTGVNVSDTMPFGMSLAGDAASISVTGTGCSGFTYSADTIQGGNVLNIIDGNMDAESVCIVSADVTAQMPGELVNSTSGVTSNELSFGVPSNSASLFVLPEASGTPFACDATMYASEVVGSSTRLYQIDTSTSTFSRSEFSGIDYAPSTGYRYTGLAYNPNDNYLYGIVTESDNASGEPIVGSVVRIDQEGKVVNLGFPEGGPNTMKMPVVSDRFVGGTMTADGNYVVVTDNSATSYAGDSIPAGERGLILEIDLSVSPPQVLFNWSHGRDVGDIAAHPDGRLLSHTVAEGLMEIDSETGDVTVLGGNVSSAISSLMANSSGQLFAHTESTGELLQIDANTGDGVVAGSLAGGITADGASCAYGVGLQKSVSVLEVEPGNSISYQLSIFNGGSTAVSFDLTDNLQNTRTFVPGSLVNPLGGTANGYGDTNLLNITGATLSANTSATITFDVMYPEESGAGQSNNQAQIQITGQSAILSDNPSTLPIGDATPVEVLPMPRIGISKRGLVSGTEVSYWFTIVNYGVGDLDSLSLSDDLDAVFGAGNYSVIAPPVLEVDPGNITVNSAFTGSGSGAVLIDQATNSTLGQDTRTVIRVSLNIDTLADMGLGYGVYSNQVEVMAETELGSTISDQSVDGDNIDPNNNNLAEEQSATVVSLESAFSITGTIFEDNGVASAVAHDGLQSGEERPLGGVTIELRNSSGTVVDSDVTGSDGRYAIAIPIALNSTNLDVVARETSGFQSISEAHSGAAGNVTDSLVTFTPDIATSSVYSADFGRIKQPSWLNNSVVENGPGTVVFHAHQYRANTSGSLNFSFTNQTASPANPDFNAVLFLDDNCNGILESNENVVPSSLAVSVSAAAGGADLVCILNKVFIPANTHNGDTFSTTIAAALSYEDSTLTGHGASSLLELTDITRTIATGEGVLVISKTVQNITAGTGITTRNTAVPDDVLRYSVYFNNTGTGPVTEVLVADSTPAYSVLNVSVQCPATLPDGIVNCQVLVPSGVSNDAGYSGPVRWQFDGSLPAGAHGTVSFDIRIE